MPTLSQFKILSKMGLMCKGRVTSARQIGMLRAEEEAETPVYLPPVTKVVSLENWRLGLEDLRGLDGGDAPPRTFFPEMVSMAMLVSRPGTSVEGMSADEIMERLHELGWRREGQAIRCNEEKRIREEEKQRQEEVQAAKRRDALDLINDPLLQRVKEKSHGLPKFSRALDSRPLAVCFDYLGPSVAPSTVKRKLDELLNDVKETANVKVVHVTDQIPGYQPRAMHIVGKNIGNRWVINLDSAYGVNRLDGLKIKFSKQVVVIRRYDDVVGTEYKTYSRQHNFLKAVNLE